jgi:hypothetical protein
MYEKIINKPLAHLKGKKADCDSLTTFVYPHTATLYVYSDPTPAVLA